MKKWEKYYNLPEIQAVRKLITDTYSNKLTFIEETHQYFLEGVEYDCVSHITHRFKKSDSRQMAENCYNKWQRQQDPNYKYYGMSVEEILDQWKKTSTKATDKGTSVHEFAEGLFHYYVGEDELIPESAKEAFVTGVPIPRNPMEAAAMKLYEDLPENYVPVLAETKVFNKPSKGNENEQAYAGTFDILFYLYKGPNSPENGLLVFDWKTNGSTSDDESKAYSKMYDNFNGETLAFPFDDLLDCDESFYRLQLACYQIPLENLGLKVVARRLFWLHPNAEYDKIIIPDMANRVREAYSIPSREEKYIDFEPRVRLKPYEHYMANKKKFNKNYNKITKNMISDKSIGNCSWLFQKLDPTDYQDFFVKYVLFSDNKNPLHSGRSIKELTELAEHYHSLVNDPNISLEDCFDDLVCHTIIETFDGHATEREAKKYLNSLGYMIDETCDDIDRIYNVDLIVKNANEEILFPVQIKPISTFLGNSNESLIEDRIRFYQKEKGLFEAYGDMFKIKELYYMVYKKNEDGSTEWVVRNKETGNLAFHLSDLCDRDGKALLTKSKYISRKLN